MKRLKSFSLAFVVQKIAEFFLLGLCLTILTYLGARTPYAAAWGIYFPEEPDILLALQAGMGLALAFYLFTLYPLVTYTIVALCRKFGPSYVRRFLPALSALVSVTYVVLWLALMGRPQNFPPPLWLVTAIMAAFIFASAAMLYPDGRRAPSAA